MKKTVITLLVLSLTIASWSQDKFALGLKLGTTSTQYTTDNLDPLNSGLTFNGVKNDAKTGLLFGAFARIKLLGNVSLQPELYYAKKSGKVSYDILNEDISAQNITYRTWDIPILANFNLIDLKVAKVYGLAGPVMSFVAENVTTLPKLTTDIENVKDESKKATWGFQLGGGLEVWKLSLDARYEWGLSNMSDGLDSDVTAVGFNRKSKMLTISLGYKLFGL